METRRRRTRGELVGTAGHTSPRAARSPFDQRHLSTPKRHILEPPDDPECSFSPSINSGKHPLHSSVRKSDAEWTYFHKKCTCHDSDECTFSPRINTWTPPMRLTREGPPSDDDGSSDNDYDHLIDGPLAHNLREELWRSNQPDLDRANSAKVAYMLHRSKDAGWSGESLLVHHSTLLAKPDEAKHIFLYGPVPVATLNVEVNDGPIRRLGAIYLAWHASSGAGLGPRTYTGHSPRRTPRSSPHTGRSPRGDTLSPRTPRTPRDLTRNQSMRDAGKWVVEHEVWQQLCIFCHVPFPEQRVMKHEAACPERFTKCTHCKKEFLKTDVHQHEDVCTDKPKPCPQCGTGVKDRLLEWHLEARCPKRTIQCPNCDINLIADELRRHEGACPKWPTICPDCNAPVRRDEIAKHDITCPGKTVVCDGCHAGIKRKVLGMHVANACPMRTVGCSHCRKDFRAKDVGEHEGRCDHQPVNCQWCNTRVKQKDAESHEQSCSARFECKHCGDVMKASTSEDHLKNCSKRPVACPLCKRPALLGSIKDKSHFRTKCPAAPMACPSGCGAKARRFQMKEHLKKCPLRKVPCKFCKKGHSLKDMKQHMGECSERPVTCKGCNQGTTLGDVRSKKHMGVCPAAPVACPLKCDQKLRRDGVKEHVQKCPMRPAACSFCQSKLRFKDVRGHMEQCSKRPVNCPLCKEKCTLGVLKNKTHFTTCPAAMIACPKGCDEKVRRDGVETHCSETCGMRELECQYCHEKQKAKDLDHHEEHCEWRNAGNCHHCHGARVKDLTKHMEQHKQADAWRLRMGEVKPYAGIHVEANENDRPGCDVGQVNANGPGQRAGFHMGDQIILWGGFPTSDFHEFKDAFKKTAKPAESVDVVVTDLDGSNERTLTITFEPKGMLMEEFLQLKEFVDKFDRECEALEAQLKKDTEEGARSPLPTAS